jgi:hypothetical protein
MNQKFYDKEYNNFQVEWRERYLKALEAKQQVMALLLADTGDATTYDTLKVALEIANLQIEALELEHKIKHEKGALADWIIHRDRDNEFDKAVKSEMNLNFAKVLEAVNLNKSIPRLSNLLLRYNGVNKQDKEEMEKIYLSMKTALEQLNIQWEAEPNSNS